MLNDIKWILYSMIESDVILSNNMSKKNWRKITNRFKPTAIPYRLLTIMLISSYGVVCKLNILLAYTNGLILEVVITITFLLVLDKCIFFWNISTFS